MTMPSITAGMLYEAQENDLTRNNSVKEEVMHAWSQHSAVIIKIEKFHLLYFEVLFPFTLFIAWMRNA